MIRRSIVAAALLGTASLLGCEDGPNQTYTAPPTGATWNDGLHQPTDGGVPTVSNGIATNSTAPFVYTDGGSITAGGQNADEQCTQDQIAALNPLINTAPFGPNFGGRLNMAGLFPDAGGPSWIQLTETEARKVNCQGTLEADQYGDSTLVDLAIGWNSNALVINYTVATDKVFLINLGPGENDTGGAPYRGTMTTTSPDGKTTYVMAVDGVTPIQVTTNGQTTPLQLDWTDALNGDATAQQPFDDIYRSLFATFYPGLPQEAAGENCAQTGACVVNAFAGSSAYFFAPVLGFGFTAGAPYTTGTIGANAPDFIFIYYTNILNFSFANPVLKMDAAGPTTLPLTLGAATTPCTLNLGQTFSDFSNNCVNTAPGGASAPANISEQLQLFSGLSHDDETYQFNILGVDLSFAAGANLGQTQVVVDPPAAGCAGNAGATYGCPNPNDVSFEISSDQSTSGDFANDWQYDANNNPIAQDLHGTGALYNDYRTLAINAIETEVCASNPSNPACAVWSAGTSQATQIQNCIAQRDSTGALITAFPDGGTFDPNSLLTVGGLPVGCTGMESFLSPDITNEDDPVNIGPIASAINANLSLGMKMGAQEGTWCADAMSRRQIAAQSNYTGVDGGVFPLTVAQVDLIGTQPNGLNQFAAATGATAYTMTLPTACTTGPIIPTSHQQLLNGLVNGNAALLPIDVQDNRFFFKQYSYALIQTLEASTGGTNALITAPVATWGPPIASSLMPIEPNDIFFDSQGSGQFEDVEYIDRRFICPDGALQCPYAGQANFACDPNSCACPATGSCLNYACPDGLGGVTCNANETSQPPLDLVFEADVRDGIMDGYDINRYLYRGETALYAMTAPPGFARARASNLLYSNVFGSPLLATQGAGILAGAFDLSGVAINPADYANATGSVSFPDGGVNYGPLSLSYQSPQVTSPLAILQTFQFEQQALLQYPDPAQPNGVNTALVEWTPNEPGNGYDVAFLGDSQLDNFVQSASIDFTGITTSELVDYNLVDGGLPDGGALFVSQSVESTDFLGDVFLCYEAAATPPLLAIRMYTPTLDVVNWLNQPLPGGANPYTDCGIVVRWSPYDNYVNLIESTTNGVRLDVTPGGGLGRIVGAQLYVPNLPVEE